MLGRVERAVLAVGEIGTRPHRALGRGRRAPALVVHRAPRGPAAAGEQHGRDLGRGAAADAPRMSGARTSRASPRPCSAASVPAVTDPGAPIPPTSASSRPPRSCARGRCRPSSCSTACQARIAARNGGEPTFDGAPGAVNAWVRLYPELARELALAADARRAAEGDGAPALCGIPLALKDLFAVRGLELTASSRVLEGNVADADSAVWRRLRGHGMVLVGHSHTHEFAAGGTTDQVGNPWALDRIAGGSSGGSAAALAAGMVPAAVGTDTAGSLRIPAALCGHLVDQAHFGRVAADGCIPLSPTLDHPGPMARSVADAAALLRALATEPGHDPDPVVAALPTSPRAGSRPLDGLRIAVTGRPEAAGVEPDVADGLQAARDAAQRLGARARRARRRRPTSTRRTR